MKKIKNTILLLFTAFAMFSCGDDDIYQTDPGSFVYDSYYENEDQFRTAINGMYVSFFDLGYYAGSGSSTDIISYGDILADNLILNPDGRQAGFSAHIWNFSGGVTTSIYQNSYKMISRANAILVNLHKLDPLVEGGEVTVESREEIRAHALAVRALAHFEIARHYVKIPTQSADANSFVGIAYVEEFIPLAGLYPARLNTVAEVYERIIADLEAAIPYLVENETDYVDGQLNRNSAMGLLSKVYLYAGDYEKVIEYAAPVVASVSPAESSELTSLWRSESSPGVLFQRPVASVSDPIIGVSFSQGNGAGLVAEYAVDKAFFDLFESTEIERRNVTARRSNPKNIYYVTKYMAGDYGLGRHHGRYLRVEEVILNLAEAYYLDTQEGMALSTLNILRDNRYSSYAGGESGDDLFNAIQLERRKELAFETGDRWFTIKRLLGVPGIPSSYSQGVVRSGNGHLYDGTGVPSSVQTLSPTAREWQFPLTNSQLVNNPNMTQTPGY